MHYFNQKTKLIKLILVFSKFKVTTGLYALLLAIFILPNVLNAQTSPNISYGSVPNYFKNSVITPINSTNSGGTVNSGNYRNVTVFAGTGIAESLDNANPLSARFNAPRGMVKDLLGNYYVAEEGGHRIRKIAANGTVTTIAIIYDWQVYDITINNANGDLYYTVDKNVIGILANTNSANYPDQNPTYINSVNWVAGSNLGAAGFIDATGTNSQFSNPIGISMAPDNSYLLIADRGNHRIRKITVPGYVVTTFAGTGTTGGNNATVNTATFSNPMDVVFASSTKVYVIEADGGNRIRTIESGAVTTLAGNSVGTSQGFYDATGTDAFMNYAFGATIDGAGNLYVAETGYHKIRKISPAGVVSTVAGTLSENSGSTDAIGNNARFVNPEGVYFDKEGGFLLVCDKNNHKIRKIDLSGYAIAPPLTAGLSINPGTGIISGTPTTYSLATQYQNNFNTATLGTTTTGGVPSINTDAAFKGELLLLTPKLAPKFGGFEIPATGINSNVLKVDFKLITEKISGGADGLSYSFAPDAVATATSVAGEIGTGSKLSLSFADYESNKGIRLFYNPDTVTNIAASQASNLAYSSNTAWIGKTAAVSMYIDDSGKLTLTINGQVIFDNIQLPAEYLNANKATWKHVFKARNGGSNDTHGIDDLSIQQGYGSTNYTVTASNGYGTSQANVAILVAEPLAITTTSVSIVTGATAVSGGVIPPASEVFVTEKGLVWSTSTNPTITSNTGMTTQGVGGTFTTTLTGLAGLTTYYARAYVTSESETIYGSEISFTTLISPPNIDYTSLSNTYVKGTVITTLNATNTGGVITGTSVSTFAGSTQGSLDGTGTIAQFNKPSSIAFDASGNMYVTDQYNHKIRKITPAGEVTTIAGTTLGEASGISSVAQFNNPSGVAITASGIIYVADQNNHKIRKIMPDGTVSNFAGDGYNGTNDGPGLTASFFSGPTSIALDALENIYATDGNAIRMITPSGVVSTFAGTNNTTGGFVNSVIATSARFNFLTGIAIGASGIIYVADAYNQKIRKITPTGVVTTLAGSTQGFSNGAALTAKFNYPLGIAVSDAGVVYVADSYNHQIRMISPTGVVSTLAGSTDGFADGLGSASQFSYPVGIAINPLGRIFVAEFNNNKIRKIVLAGNFTVSPALPDGLSLDQDTGAISGTPIVASSAIAYTITGTNAGGSSSKTISITILPMNSPAINYTTPNVFVKDLAINTLNGINAGGIITGATVSTLAGGSISGTSNGTGTSAQFSYLRDLASDASGNMYASELGSNSIRKITSTGVVTTFAGGDSSFSSPYGLAVSTEGIVYISDLVDFQIRKILIDGTMTVLAGSGIAGYADGLGTGASFKKPYCMALDASNNLYITDLNRIRKITPSGQVTTIAGDINSGDTDGQGTQARFNFLTGITISATTGIIYVVDENNHKIKAISPTGAVTTLAGSTRGFADGIGTVAQFNYPVGITSDSSGFLYVTDTNNHKIRKILTTTGMVTTLAGTSTFGFLDGDANNAKFFNLKGIALDAWGSIYVTDSNNDRIRKIEVSGYTISPDLPVGLSLNATTGAITGTPTVASAATDYVVTGSNAGGSSSFTISIQIIAVPVCNVVLNPASQTSVACHGGSTGTATVNAATGGTAPYTYNWTSGTLTVSGTTSVTGLSAGIWTCTVTDAYSCTATKDFTITQPTALVLTPASQTNIACHGGSTGAATVNAATGGAAPYTYNWTSGTLTADGTTAVTGLSAGNWTCTVTDVYSCTATKAFTITQPTALAEIVTTQTACGSYTWAANGTTYTASGTYTSLIGCQSETLNLTITPSTSNATSATGCDSYTWSVNGTTYTDSGTYTSVVGCHTETLNLTITPNSIVFTTQPVNTSICNKFGIVNLTAAITPIVGATYQWKVQTATGTVWENVNNSSVHYSGATTPVLNIQQATALLNNNKYKLVVTSPTSCSSVVTSDICVLTVNPIPTGAVISGAGTICENSSKTLRIANTLVGSVQWQVSTVDTTTGFTDIEGATGSIYTTDALTSTTYYRVVVSSGVCDSKTSQALTVTVIPAPLAGTISGGDVTVCIPLTSGLDLSGNSVPFSNSTLLSVAGTTGAITWQKSTNYENATGATPVWASALSTTNELTVTNLTVDTWYKVLVSNGACTVASTPVKITVTKAARAGVVSSPSSVCSGGDITFTSSAYTGTSIQWEVSTTSATSGFTPIADANQLSFTMNAIAYASLSKFYVRSVVTSGDCSIARSAVKTITVSPQSVAGTVTGGGIICSGVSKSVTVTGYTGAIQWQSSIDGISYVNVTGSATSATYSASNITADTYFRAKITSGICSVAYSNAVQYTIGTAVAGTLTAADLVVCKGSGTSLTLSGSVGSIKWFKSTNWTATTPTWSAVSSTATTVSTGNLSVSTAYKAEVTIGSCSTVSSEVLPVMVNAAPLAKTITANVTSPTGTTSALAICNTSSTSKVLTIGGGSIGAIQWQKSTSSSTSGFVDIADATATSYTVTNPTVGANYFRAKFTNSCGVSVFGTAIRVYYKECAPTKAITSVVTGKTSFAVVSYPNPFSNNFNLDVTSSSSEKVSVVVYDMIGRLLEKHLENVSEINTLEIGTNYPAGVYNVIVTQGLEVKTVRVIKK